jgi:hypothetical protein
MRAVHVDRWVTYDTKRERFVGESYGQANAFLWRADRAPFAVPTIA